MYIIIIKISRIYVFFPECMVRIKVKPLYSLISNHKIFIIIMRTEYPMRIINEATLEPILNSSKIR